MKDFILKFKKFIKFSVSLFACREFGFIFCLIGTIGQVAHTYFLTSSISSLDGNWKTAQAVMLSIFISASLLYFVSIADDKESKDSKRIRLAVNIFMVIEILINVYYYSRHLIIDPVEIQIFDFIFAILISCLIPITIKLYAGLINAKDWLLEFEEIESPKELIQNGITKEEVEQIITSMLDVTSRDLDRSMIEDFIQQLDELKNTEKSNNIDDENLNKKMEEFIDLKIDDIKDKFTNGIKETFETQQKLFLNQFENKCVVLLNEKIKQLN